MSKIINIFKHKKHWFKKPRIILIIAIFVVLLAIFSAFGAFNNNNDQTEELVEKTAQIEVLSLADDYSHQESIKVAGLVKAATKVDVVALGNGTVRSISFDIGDEVKSGKLLATLYDNVILTSLNNASIYYNNLQLNYDATRRTTDEMVGQAQLGVKNAQESLESAEISLAAAEDNLNNSSSLQDKNVVDTKNSAVIAANSYLNTVNNALDQINFILKVDGESQLPGIADTLGVLDSQSVVKAKSSYEIARDSYSAVLSNPITLVNIEDDIDRVVSLLAKGKQAVDDTIEVLNNTITSITFDDVSLLTQKNNFASLRSTVVASQTSAEGTKQSLQNIDLINKKEFDALQSAVKQATNQLQLAKLSYDNAQIALNNAYQSQQQQLISAQTTLDSARGQVSIAQAQVSDLNITAPIRGQITKKSIELGSELRVGEKIAEISQNNLVKIELELSSDDIYQVKLGQSVIIADDLNGIITHIDPAADENTKKVGVEVAYDNKDKALIPETFINVEIPLAAQEKENVNFMIPLKAVTIAQTGSFVFIVENNTAIKKEIQIGSISGDQVEVTSGLSEEMDVIVEGNKNIEDGDIVEIK